MACSASGGRRHRGEGRRGRDDGQWRGAARVRARLGGTVRRPSPRERVRAEAASGHGACRGGDGVSRRRPCKWGWGGRRRAARAGKEGGREKEEKGKKEKERKKERKRERERESASAKLAAATAGPDEHGRRSGGTQRVARNEGEQGDGMVIGTGVGTADCREKFRKNFFGARTERNSKRFELSDETKF